MTFSILDDTKEYQCPEGFEIMALCDKENNIHVVFSKDIDSAIKNKSNLYELIAERIQQGDFIQLEDFKCYLVKKEELMKGEYIQ